MTRWLKADNCAECGYLHDAITGIGAKNLPLPGDLSVCLRCGWVTMFDDNLDRRPLTIDESKEFASNKQLIAIQRFIGSRK